MHPNKAFRFESDAAMLDWAIARGFAHILAATAEGPVVAHAPIVPAGAGAVRFHLARGNRIVPVLDGARVVLSIAGPDGYITPNWYADPAQQVPTWNYVAVELEGTMRRMQHDALIAQVDQLTAQQEGRLDKTPWTRGKMDPAIFDKMTSAIIGFRLEIAARRGTLKLGQNKPEAARLSAADGVEASGRRGIAHWMRNG